MSTRRWLVLITLIAALHGIFYGWYQSPDWFTHWTDQDGYRKLGAALATTGRFTRYVGTPTYVPEVIRTPGYPALLAVVYKVAGTGQAGVVAAQIVLFVLICWIVFAMAREVVSERLAVAAAALTACYPPIPYFAGLVMTEVFATFWCTVAIWLTLRARRTGRWQTAALAGFAMAATALVRPAFALLPVFMFGVAFVLYARQRMIWAGALVATAITLAPWFAYNYVFLHRITISPANGLGRAVWEGTWQGRWSGRVQDQLTDIADTNWDRPTLDAKVRAFAGAQGVPAAPMLTYVHQWQDIRRIWTEPTESFARINARMTADQVYMRTGFQNILADPVGHIRRRLTVGFAVLWAGEIPIRYSDINGVPKAAIVAIWVAQAIVFGLGLFGIVALARQDLTVDAALLATPIVYVTAVHLPLLTEARQSLPAYPTVLLLATCGVAQIVHRLRPSPAATSAAARA